MRPGSENDVSRGDAPGVGSFLDEDDRVAANGNCARARHESRARLLGRRDQPPAAQVVAPERSRVPHTEPDPELFVDLSAEGRPLVDESEADPGRRGFGNGGEASGAAADDQEVVGLCSFCTHGYRSVAAGRRAAGRD
jgi:hypothetical protein